MLRIAIVAAVAYAAICVLLFVRQRSFIYFPQARFGSAPAGALTLSSSGERVLVTARRMPSRDAVIYFGGNAEDVTYSYPDLAAAFSSHSLFLLHYRGYGGSSGTPTEAGLFADARALYEHVAQDHDRIVLVGRSLGSGLASRLASVVPVSRLVLVTPFDSLASIAARQFPIFPARLLMLDRFESDRHAPKVTAPTLLIVGGRDEIIPLRSSDALLRSFKPGIATMKVIEGCGHNDVQESPEFVPLLRGAVDARAPGGRP